MNQEEKDKIAEECVFNTPLALLIIDDQEIINKVNNYLPYSTGFEIECKQQDEFDIEAFKSIPNILEVNGGSKGANNEQRFRIPNGINGLICLQNISEQLKLNSELNLKSGIHYHIDMTDCFDLVTDDFIKDNEDWILEELDTWEYKGTYNNRTVTRSKTWVKFHGGHKTLEIRIGEMTFDYELLIKRIVHCNQIVRKLKSKLFALTYMKEQINFTEIDKEKVLIYLDANKSVNLEKLKQMNLIHISDLEAQIKALTEQPVIIEALTENQINQIIKNRNVKIS